MCTARGATTMAATAATAAEEEEASGKRCAANRIMSSVAITPANANTSTSTRMPFLLLAVGEHGERITFAA